MSKRFGVFILLALMGLLSFGIVPAYAAGPPSIVVNPVWRPPAQLTTIDANADGITNPGDDIRYATADIYVTANVEFWAVGFTCTVNKAVLESYVYDSDPNSFEDNALPFNEGADWANVLKQFVNTTDTDGKVNFAISVAGTLNPPMGSNGTSVTLHIATLKYRVKEGLVAAGTSPFTCTTSFLNTDGKVVLAASYVAPAPLSIIPGYTLSGKATYQGTTIPVTPAQAIDVLCDDSDGDAIFDDVVTKANVTTGLFSVNNLRTQGRYDCQFIGNIRTPGVGSDLHLMSNTDFNLTTGSFALLPLVLRSGNVNSLNAAVDGNDVTAVTSNWNAPLTTVTSPYLLGDATGDRKINEADLAVVASNYGRAEPYPGQHLIFSLPRDVNVLYNSHLWMGSSNNSTVTQFVAGVTRDYWPALAPNGAKIAFIRNVGVGAADKFALFIAPIVNGVPGVAVRITPAAATYDAFAPAWSPDGSQLAFVCSYNQEWASASAPKGTLCLIDATGFNFRQPIDSNLHTSIPLKIQSPAWIDNQNLHLAHPVLPSLGFCSNSLCTLNIAFLVLGHPAAIPPGSDMPVVRDTVLGSTLFYRFDNGAGSHTIRYAQITSGLPFNAYPNTTPGGFHDDVKSGASVLSTLVDYFTVSTGADPDIVFYNSSPSTNDPGGKAFSIRPFNGTAAAPNWTIVTSSVFTISGGIGNPAFASGYNEALRNTIAFVP